MLSLSAEERRRLTFLDEPVFHAVDEYTAVRDRYVQQVAGLPGVSSVYQMGSVGAPGVSDLDLIVVLEGDGPFAPARTFSTAPLGSTGRYMFMHPGAQVIDAATFRELDLLFYASHLTRLWGDDISIRPPEEREARDAGAAILADHAIHLLHQLVKALISRTVYVRRILMALSGVTHTLEVARRIGLPARVEWTGFLAEVMRLKNGWFDAPDREALVTLLVEGINVVAAILMDLEGFLRERGVIETDGSGDELAVVRHTFNAFTVYAARPDALLDAGLPLLGQRGVRLKLGQKYLNASLSVVPVPLAFWLQYWAYGTGDSDLAHRLRRLLHASPEEVRRRGRVDEEYRGLMARRADLWAASLGFLARHDLLAYDVMPFLGSQHLHTRGHGASGAVMRFVQNVVTLGWNDVMFRGRLLPRLRRAAAAPREA